MKRIGVLALQGAFAEHIAMLHACGAEAFEIRQKHDLDRSLDGLVLPGGESTVMGKLLRDLELFDPVRTAITQQVPVLGTCAGLILLARELCSDPVVHLGTLDVAVKRNAYGRQLGSFRTDADFTGIGTIPMVFIRAPYIASVGAAATALAEVDGNIVAAQQGKQLAVAFHPELTEDTRLHQYFLQL